MEMQNRLAPQAKKNTNLVTYESNGGQVSLSIDIVRKYLISGGGNPSDAEIVVFIGKCKAQRLDPFNGDVHLVKYGSNSPAAMIIGKDVYFKRAQQNANFDGMESGIIVQVKETGQIIERKGTFYIPQAEELVGAWAQVFLKNCAKPFYESVNLSEYIGKKKDGTINEQWQKRPATMIQKVAQSHALKAAFPAELEGVYLQEEIPEASGMDLLSDTKISESAEAPVRLNPEPAPEVVYETTAQFPDAGYQQATWEPAPQSPESVLFGN